MNVILNGVETQITQVGVVQALRSVLPEWAVYSAQHDIANKRLDGHTIDLTRITDPARTPYRIIGLSDAKKLCSEHITDEQGEALIPIIEQNLDGYLKTHKGDEDGIKFLVSLE